MHVGMNRSLVRLCRSGVGVPHARGDEPAKLVKELETLLSSPCTWG